MAGEWRNSSAQEPTVALHGARPSSFTTLPLSPGHSFPKHSLASLLAQPVLGDVDTQRKQAWPGQVLQLTSRLGTEVRMSPTASLLTVRLEWLGRPGLRTHRQPKKKVWAKGYARQVHRRQFRERKDFIRGTSTSSHQINKVSLVLWEGLNGHYTISSWVIRPQQDIKTGFQGRIQPESQRTRPHLDGASVLNGEV